MVSPNRQTPNGPVFCTHTYIHTYGHTVHTDMDKRLTLRRLRAQGKKPRSSAQSLHVCIYTVHCKSITFLSREINALCKHCAVMYVTITYNNSYTGHNNQYSVISQCLVIISLSLSACLPLSTISVCSPP